MNYVFSPDLATHLNTRIYKLQTLIFQETGETFNLNSPKQLGHILYEKLKIPAPTKKGAPILSTSAEILEELQDKFPVCNMS